MASFLTNLRNRVQTGIQNTVRSSVEDLRDEDGNILSVGVDVNVGFDPKTTAIALAMVLFVAVAILLIKKGLKV